MVDQRRSPNHGCNEFDFPFAIGDKVTIDGDDSVVAVVTSIQITAGAFMYRVTWMQDGHMREPWVEEFRLKMATAL